MLFKDINNKLIEINRYNYKNDKLYYKKIYTSITNNKIKNNEKNNTINKIDNILKNRIY